MLKFIAILTFILLVWVSGYPVLVNAQSPGVSIWSVKSIDTMKYSRDLAREKIADPDFNQLIDLQITAIASTGATHVAIATPYDEEFYPFLKRWVDSARKHNLRVWFRGNWAGWEGWFGYSSISSQEHLQKTKTFITTHPDLFLDGDIFTSCPECENGSLGDPRQTGKVTEYRQFIIDLYHLTSASFSALNKQIITNYFSMNADVASLVMDPSTTLSLDGVVCLDHYVSTPEKLASDLKQIIQSTRASQLILGEFGAPIPDIHGTMNQFDQAKWLNDALTQISALPQVTGLNYWTGFGSSTSLWSANNLPRTGVLTLTHFYTSPQITINIQNEINQPLKHTSLSYANRSFPGNNLGQIVAPYVEGFTRAQVSAPGYIPQTITLGQVTSKFILTLKPSRPSLIFRIRVLTYNILHATINAIKQ